MNAAAASPFRCEMMDVKEPVEGKLKNTPNAGFAHLAKGDFLGPLQVSHATIIHSHFGKFGSRSPDWQVFSMGDSIMGLTAAGRSYEQPATAAAMAMHR